MKVLRVIFVIHGVITLAGAVVLVAFPTAIPSLVGISLQREDYLLVYLVAAAELAVAILSFGAARLTDRTAVGLVVATLVALHLTSGILDMVYMGVTQTDRALVVNTALRFVVVAVLLLAWRGARSHQIPGTSR